MYFPGQCLRGILMRVPTATHRLIGEPVNLRIGMTIDRIVLAFTGTMVLLSLLLGLLVSPYWLLLTGFVGLNLLQSAFTGFCPLAILLKKLGQMPGPAFR
jgi:hypothetical protein